MSKKLTDKAKKSFCVLPWTHSFVNLGGEYQVCCTSEEFLNNNIRNDEGKPINIMDGMSPEEVMNTQYMKDLRLKMLNGQWDEVCGRCLITEENNGVSRRNIENIGYEEFIPSLLESTQEDGTIDPTILSADYRLGNICNLQCRMCNPKSTLKWVDEWNEIKPEREKFPQELIEEYRGYDWYDRPELIEDFKKKAGTIKFLHFAGGEPLIVPQMRRILEECIKSGNAKNITITYNTNLTVLPQKVIELWKQFKGVKLLISVDATGGLK
jgi:sulfatase maturation enzyme AslB (radical SAM superfamily)